MTDYVIMKDSSTAPSFVQAQQFAADGVSVWGLYIGGRTPHIYTTQEVANLEQGGIHSFVGFWVAPLRKYGQLFTYALGHVEGLAACHQAEMLGFTPAELAISPDVEDNAEGSDVDDYCRGFKDAVRSVTTAALIGYANPGTVRSGAFNGYDGAIVADYLTPPATSPYDARLGLGNQFAGRRGVQAVGTHDEHGLGVDTSYLDPWYASNATGGDNVDQALASGFVKAYLANAAFFKALTTGQPVDGNIIFQDVVNPAAFAVHRDALVNGTATPEDIANNISQQIGGVHPGGLYPLPAGPQGPAGDEGPQGPPGAAGGVHHHGVTVDITGAVTGTGTGTTSDPI